MKSVLILGCGPMQKPAITSAKELGYKVFAIDANENAACVNDCDVFNHIDLKDREKILQYASELKETENLTGIFTAATDFSKSVSYAGEKLNFNCHSFESSLNASDKILMRECFKKNNIPSPNFIKITKSQKSEFISSNIISEFNFPLVVKPVDNMGARGCRMIRSIDELDESLSLALDNSISGTCILEEYIDGPEFSIDAILYNDTMTITGFADRHIYFKPYFVELGHTMSTTIEKSKYDELLITFALAVKSLGLTTGACKADIKYSVNGPVVGEIAARLSGGYMSGWTFPYASELNLTKEALKIACNETPDLLEKSRIELDINSCYKMYQVKTVRTSAERAWISIPGVIKNIYGLDSLDALNIQELKNIFVNKKVGDTVVFPRNNVQKCGNLITVSDDYQKAVTVNENCISQIVLELEANNSQTIDFLEGKKIESEKDFPPNAFNFDNDFVSNLYNEIDNFEKKTFSTNENIFDTLPKCLNTNLALQTKDWNHRTLEQTLLIFEKFKPKNKDIEIKKFYRYLINGGIQGALYAAN